MHNEINSVSVVNQKKRCIKNKNMKLDLFLMSAFTFEYAGKCHVFIHTRRNKFELVHQGVHIVEDIYTFSPNYISRYLFDDLYHAILAFNKSVMLIVNTMDWYKPDLFVPYINYEEVFIKD